jgi:hypothetical protein
MDSEPTRPAPYIQEDAAAHLDGLSDMTIGRLIILPRPLVIEPA